MTERKKNSEAGKLIRQSIEERLTQTQVFTRIIDHQPQLLRLEQYRQLLS